MESPLKQRLIGAAVLAALAIVFLPALLDGPDVKDPDAAEVPLAMPAAPDDKFETRELALAAPEDVPAGGVLGMDTAPAPAVVNPPPVAPVDPNAAAPDVAPPAATPAVVPNPTPVAPVPAAPAPVAAAPTPQPEPVKPVPPASVAGVTDAGPRGLDGATVAARLGGAVAADRIVVHATVAEALAGARRSARAGERVLVFGSFHTVADALRAL